MKIFQRNKVNDEVFWIQKPCALKTNLFLWTTYSKIASAECYYRMKITIPKPILKRVLHSLKLDFASGVCATKHGSDVTLSWAEQMDHPGDFTGSWFGIKCRRYTRTMKPESKTQLFVFRTRPRKNRISAHRMISIQTSIFIRD